MELDQELEDVLRDLGEERLLVGELLLERLRGEGVVVEVSLSAGEVEVGALACDRARAGGRSELVGATAAGGAEECRRCPPSCR